MLNLEQKGEFRDINHRSVHHFFPVYQLGREQPEIMDYSACLPSANGKSFRVEHSIDECR